MAGVGLLGILCFRLLAARGGSLGAAADAMLTVGAPISEDEATASVPSLIAVLKACCAQRVVVWLIAASAFRHMAGYAEGAFQATFYHRALKMEPSEYGPWLAGLIVIGGGIASIGNSWLADRMLRHTNGARMYVMSGGHAIGVVVMTATWLLHARLPCQLMHVATYLMIEGWLAIAIAELSAQNSKLVGSKAGSTVVAVYLLLIDIAGGLGPFLVGLISDMLVQSGHSPADSMRLALVYVVSPCLVLTTLLFYKCARTLHLAERQLQVAGAHTGAA